MTCKCAFTRTHVEWNRSRSRIELQVGVSFEQEEHWSPTRLRTGEVFCQNWPIISSAVFMDRISIPDRLDPSSRVGDAESEDGLDFSACHFKESRLEAVR